MPDPSEYLIVSIHDFKTNLSRYLRLIHRGEKRGIVVRRYKRDVAVLFSTLAKPRPEKKPDLVHQH